MKIFDMAIIVTITTGVKLIFVDMAETLIFYDSISSSVNGHICVFI